MSTQKDPYEKVPVITEKDIFRPGENVFIHISTQHPDFIGVIHKHTFIEIVYVVSGSATHIVGNRSVPATKGDLFIINYDTPHGFFKNKDDSEPMVAYDLSFTPGFLDSSLLDNMRFESISSSFLFYSLFPEEQMGPDVHISGSSYGTFGELFNKIYLEYVGQETGYINIIRAYLVELIVRIFRKMDSAANTDNALRQTQIVNTALDYMHKNYHKHLSLDELATQVFLSKDYLGRLFRETTGMTVNALLQKIRIEEACKMLVTTDHKIESIAAACGFSDLKYFYTTFKKYTGLTPRQYKVANLETQKGESVP